jgi:glutamyl-tRNA synthetase
MPGTDVIVPDLIRGDTHFPADDLRDFVIMRSDGTPTYLMAAAVDDVLMRMTHVIRGEDLLPSTPRQMQIMAAMGATPPAFAHLPLITGADGAPLSKRHGSVAVEWFRDQGFLPEALVNYLALLGWSLDEHTTFLSRDDLIEHFDLARVGRNPSRFDQDKLLWMNGHYIRELDDARLTELLVEALFRDGIEAELPTVRAAVPLIQERMKTTLEGAAMIRFLFVDDVEPDAKAAKMLGDDRAEYLRDVAARLEALPDWTHTEIEAALRGLQSERELSSNQAFQPFGPPSPDAGLPAAVRIPRAPGEGPLRGAPAGRGGGPARRGRPSRLSTSPVRRGRRRTIAQPAATEDPNPSPASASPFTLVLASLQNWSAGEDVCSRLAPP